MFRRFMYGRYGVDQLNNAILILSLIFCLVNLFTTGIADLIFFFLYFIMILLYFMRTMSRNYARRRRENEVFLRGWYKVKNWFKGIPGFFKRLGDRKHKYFKCPNCRSRLRVPRGRGNITVTCPRCYVRFDKKS